MMKFMEIEQRGHIMWQPPDCSHDKEVRKLLKYDVEMQDTNGKVLQVMTGLLRMDLEDLRNEIDAILGCRQC
jgi:monomeric isocitrate dehydrogenase